MTESGRPGGPRIVRLGRSTSGEDQSNVVIRLRRNDTSHPWGFRMLGGRDQGSCLYVHKVNPRSIAERSGLRPGDGIMAVGGVAADGMTHDRAKQEILRAGNELDFYVSRNAMPVTSEIVKRQCSMEESRAEIIEEPSDFSTGYQNPNIQSRSFKILQEALNYTEATDDVSIYRFHQAPESEDPMAFIEANLAGIPKGTMQLAPSVTRPIIASDTWRKPEGEALALHEPGLVFLPKTLPNPVPQPQSAPALEPQPQSVPELHPQPEPAPEPQPQQVPAEEPQPQPEYAPQTQPQPVPPPEPQGQLAPQPQFQYDPELGVSDM